MQLPDIDFAKIRLHRNDQANAFEELCCQLAGDEDLPQKPISFIRKGLGADGGVECFATLPDGTETGWQVKYYWNVASAIDALDDSLNRALAKHPKMTRFIACLPFDLPDSRKDDVLTGLDRWNRWRNARIAGAAASGRLIEIDRWDAFELKKRLTASSATVAGRVAYWFNQSLLTPDWFQASFERARTSLGERYSPQDHVRLPIRRVIDATTLDPYFFQELSDFSKGIAQALANITKDSVAAINACEALVQTLDHVATGIGKPIQIASVREAVAIAKDAVLSWHQSQRGDGTHDRPSAHVRSISNLASMIDIISQELAAEHWDRMSTRALLVVGEAGAGKSHLLADVCDHAIESGRPAVMVLSGKLPDAEPWSEILRELGLPRDITTDIFLGALNAAGEASGVRALLVIDALNEKNGRLIWPTRLAGLVHDVGRYEWISLVLSCRSTYEDVVIPTELDGNRLPRVRHEGFSARQAREYLKKRGIRLAEEPNSIRELETPLFLRICCDALALRGQEILTHSLGSITQIFKHYTGAVIEQVYLRSGIASQRRIVERIVTILAKEMAETGREEVSISRAYDLVATLIPPTTPSEQDILFQLQNEGLLSAQPSNESHEDEELRFTFQRISDHAIASSLLESSVKGDAVVAAFAEDTPLHKAMKEAPWGPWEGVMEALAVQLPERYGVELADMPDMAEVWGIDEAFKSSLLTRDPRTINHRTWELIEDAPVEGLRYETLIAFATDPNRSHNADFLDSELRRLNMAQRDAVWSTHLSIHRQSAEKLIDWIREADHTAIDPTRTGLAGVQLCWFLTTSDREIRDNATKALVFLLAGAPVLAEALWQKFRHLDDAYVTERLVAAIFGAAMQGRWSSDALASVVEQIHTGIFVNDGFPANALTRDHARGLVHYAKSRGALSSTLDSKLADPPYRSPWPIPYVSEAEIESYTRTYDTGSQYRDEIAISTVFDGDFARYQIDFCLRDWSVALKGSRAIPTPAELSQNWLKAFRQTATPEMLAAHNALESALSEARGDGAGSNRGVIETAKKNFRTAVGEDLYAQWSAEASDWFESGMFKRSRRHDAPAQFNLAWARRWVCKRAHELGWSEALHGEFDSSVRNDRHTHAVERIGKKYQWIALYELCARAADNLRPLSDEYDSSHFQRLRNIDPSLLTTNTQDDGWRRFEEPSFWVPSRPGLHPTTLDEALEWLDADIDLRDSENNIAVTNPADNRQWLVLNGFENWRDGGQHLKLDMWRRIACFVVRRRDLKKTLDLISGQHFQSDGDVPSARGGQLHSYLGEHPWAWRVADTKFDDEWITGWSPDRFSGGPRVSIRPTTTSYLAESASYDASITQNINIRLPAAWLIDSLGLHLTDGKTIEYVDADKIVRFMDPSVAMTGRSAALIDRKAFLAYLAKEKLVAIWALAGEKNVYGEGSRSGFGGFGGRWTYTRFFHSQRSDIVALERYQTYDAPDADQLASLRSLSENGVSGG